MFVFLGAKSVCFMLCASLLLISSVLLNVLQIHYAFKLLRNLVYRLGTLTFGNDETAVKVVSPVSLLIFVVLLQHTEKG